MNIGAARHKKLIPSASAHNFGIAPSKLSCKLNEYAMLVDNSKEKQIQRAVAAASFYSSVRGRIGTVLIAKRFHETLMRTKNDQVSCSFENILQFLRIESGKIMYSRCYPHDSHHCFQCTHVSAD